MDVRPFISYAREDRSIARRLFRDLSACGSQPWLDIENLLGGQNWQRAISSAIRECSHFLALISHQSVSKRGFVQREVAQALQILEMFPPDEVFVIPVRLEDCQPKHERLSQLQWIDMFPSYDSGLRQLTKSLGLTDSPRLVLDADANLRTEILQLPAANPIDEPSDRNVVPVSALRALARDRQGFLSPASVAKLVLERSQGNPSLIADPILLLKNASQQTGWYLRDALLRVCLTIFAKESCTIRLGGSAATKSRCLCLSNHINPRLA